MKLWQRFWHQFLKRPYRLATTEQGSGRTVVLLHGVGAKGGVWEPLARLLDKKRWRTVVPDLLGFGESPTPEWGTYDVNEHARAVMYTLKRLKVKGQITIVGHSMGCLVAAHIAAKQPELVERLVLYEPPLYTDNPEFSSHLRWRQYYFALYAFIANHPELASMEAQLVWRLAQKIMRLKLSEEQWLPFERSLRNTIMRQTAYQELRHIKIATDIIHGRLDLVVTRADLRRMFKANRFIAWHTVTDFHAISVRSARYLARLLG